MTDRLSTPLTHGLIASSIGLLFQSRLFERVTLATVDREFGVLRARAAADVAGTDLDAFLDELDVTASVEQSLRTKIVRALGEHRSTRSRDESLATEWDEVFWGAGDRSTDGDSKRSGARQGRSGSPQRTFEFLSKTGLVDVVAFDVPNPEAAIDEMTQHPTTRETLDRWGVPETNRLEWDCGHFGVTLRAMRTEAFQEFVRTALAIPA